MKTTRRDKELFESQHYNRRTTRPLTFPFSRSFSAPLNGRGLADGMWFDGVNDTVLVDGSSFNGKTKGKITGVFQTVSTGSVCVCAATDAGDTASDLRIHISSGKFQFAARENSGHDIYVTTNATYNDGAAHTFEVKVTDSGNFITIDGVLLEASELTYSTGSASSHIWFSDVYNVDMWAMGVRQESVPDNKFLGVVRDIKIYDEDTTTVIGHWAGHGNTDADWLDLSGNGNDGTVAGSPSRAISKDGGKTWAEDV